jgi:hypothetical protein
MLKPIDAATAVPDDGPLNVRMDRKLAEWLGALQPIYGINLEHPVMLVTPTDGMPPGLFWPIDLDAYRKK